MKKIVWLCSMSFSTDNVKSTGSWLQPMALYIQKNREYQLYNIAANSVIEKVKKCDFLDIPQWTIPGSNNMDVPIDSCREVEAILDSIKPDLVHIWGTENLWSVVYRKGFIKYKTLVDIQGLLFAYTDYYYGGLDLKDIFFKTFGLKELLIPKRMLLFKKKMFYERGQEEIACLKAFENISYQSEWVKNQVSTVNKSAHLFKTSIMLRNAFYHSDTWKFKPASDSPIIFSSASAAVSYKGLHVLIKAVSLLKSTYPNIQLRLAGKMHVGEKLIDGYSLYLKKLVKQLYLEDNVIYTGSLDEKQIVNELLSCNVCVIPSFIETYCLAFAESMIVGVPTVASFAGAMPELAKNEEEALFYNSIDFGSCAAQIKRLIEDMSLARKLSINGRKRRLIENKPDSVLAKQLSIYNELII
ncbi:glycosyltransferase family 4 protein [Zunongwangia sp. SCSIO 43204]|uniref:glycosyltransferase family 4 protein n=1 Tax=Zunongwangia sp. SCSIO 43204 TaxID=2779359 RepID=UPI001CA94F27|nr:glycosyltransferase family 4 protein [Zunongwangia sp. SCSIO 43204]UAB84826.1 glycosyltransferase family 4 protein [Zunongwangia sp. SCSIO 43204]